VGTAVSVRGVRHRLGGREVLRVDRLDVPAGARLAVLGPNGAGKSTLLRLLAGLEAPTTGTVLVDGAEAARRPLSDRRRSAYVTQRAGLLTETAAHNVEIPLRWRGLPRQECRARARAALDRLGVLHLADRPAAGLSGGERQRVSLARALALDPLLLLLDEPAAALDVPARQELLTDLERAVTDAPASTVVHVTHRPAEALRMADTVAVLVAGELRQVATPAALLRRPADEVVARLVGYETLVPAVLEPDGRVVLDGHLLARAARDRWDVAHDGAGRVTAACFAAGVCIRPCGAGGLPATVVRASPGPGHGIVRLAACGGRITLTAHLPHGAPLPQPGRPAAVMLDPALTVLVPRRGSESSPSGSVVAAGAS
jgi:ABC-type sugar transport system ATPase subunit